MPADTAASDGIAFTGWWECIFAWGRTIVTAAVYTKLIVLFLFQVARVDGQSMAPTLADRDRLIVNKFTIRSARPAGRHRDVLLPAESGRSVRQARHRRRGRHGPHRRRVCLCEHVPLDDSYVPPEYRSHEDFGQKPSAPASISSWATIATTAPTAATGVWCRRNTSWVRWTPGGGRRHRRASSIRPCSRHAPRLRPAGCSRR